MMLKASFLLLDQLLPSIIVDRGGKLSFAAAVKRCKLRPGMCFVLSAAAVMRHVSMCAPVLGIDHNPKMFACLKISTRDT